MAALLLTFLYSPSLSALTPSYHFSPLSSCPTFDVIKLSSPWLTSTPLAFHLPFQYFIHKGVTLCVLHITHITGIGKIDASHTLENVSLQYFEKISLHST
jgi:hypothetical protein